MLPTGSFTDKMDRLSPLYEVHFNNRVREIVDFAQDTMRFQRIGGLRTETRHLPYTIDGSESPIAVTGHEEAFLAGFRAAYETFLSCKEDIIDRIASSQDCVARILFRNTKEYGAALLMMESERCHGCSDQILAKFSSAGRDIDESIRHSEERTLRAGYIPAFFCGFGDTGILY